MPKIRNRRTEGSRNSFATLSWWAACTPACPTRSQWPCATWGPRRSGRSRRGCRRHRCWQCCSWCAHCPPSRGPVRSPCTEAPIRNPAQSNSYGIPISWFVVAFLEIFFANCIFVISLMIFIQQCFKSRSFKANTWITYNQASVGKIRSSFKSTYVFKCLKY